MAFNVRIFGHRGLRQLPVILAKQFASDSIYQMIQPYEFGETINVGVVAVSSAPNVAAETRILRIEVPDGELVRYEVNPPSRAVAAGVNSPILSGINHIDFHPGWSLSLIDAAGLP